MPVFLNKLMTMQREFAEFAVHYCIVRSLMRRSIMTATNHDDQRHNLVKFVQRCQMSFTVVKRLYIWRHVVTCRPPYVYK